MTKTPPIIVGKPVLLLVDMQKCWFANLEDLGTPVMGDAHAQVQQTKMLLSVAREYSVPVIFTKEVHRRSLIDFGRELDGEEKVHCLDGDPGTEIIEELKPLSSDYQLEKRRYSAFFATDLEILLRALQVQTIIICGGLTDVCVHYTFVDAHQCDYYVRVLEECCIGSSKSAHSAALNAMEYLQKGARRRVEEVNKAFRKLKN